MTISKILARSLAGEEISTREGEVLFSAEREELQDLIAAADEVRRRLVGDRVTYVVNRNINFTNVCVKQCGFCAFSRGHRSEQGYFLPVKEVIRRARQAWSLGASEVCIQAGLPPNMKGSYYADLCQAVKSELPNIHVHGFSPEEVLYGANLSEKTVESYLALLKEAGVGSLPGTSAEILDDEIREIISPGRISTKDWVHVVKSAHRLGIATTSTIMYGHIETSGHLARHLALLRDVQKETGGITEFVPLSFIHYEAPMFRKNLVDGLVAGPTREDVLRMYAVARIMLAGWINNIQASWVKQGRRLAQECLNAGANDFGGTLMNESISTAAGAEHGQFLRPSEIRQLIRHVGREPAERWTDYTIRCTFGEEPANPDTLDAIDRVDERFGSYSELMNSNKFGFGRQTR